MGCLRVQMMKEVFQILLCCTDREALNLGVLLHDTLQLLERWRVRNDCKTCSIPLFCLTRVGGGTLVHHL